MTSMNSDREPNGHLNDGDPVFSTPPSFKISFPQRANGDKISQDAEIFDVTVQQRIRIHDYDVLYSYPGLYE